MSLKILHEFSGSSSSVRERTIIPVKDVQSSPFLTKGEIAVDSQSGFYYSDGTQWISPAEAGAASVNISDSSGPSGSASLIVDAQGPNLGLKKLTQGANIVLTQNGGDIMISGVAGPTSNLVDQGPGASLVTSGVGPVLGVRKIIGSGIVSVTENADDITITATATTITDSGSGLSLITGGTGPALGVKKIVAGANIVLDGTDPNNLVVSSTGGGASATIEHLATAVANTTVTPSPFVNITFLSFTQTTGTTSGTLANGAIDGFEKTITYSTGTTQYVLTITNFLDEFNIFGAKIEPFFQAGKSVTYVWNATKGAWIAKSKNQLYSNTTVTIRLDPNDPTKATAVRNDGYIYPLRGVNSNVNATNNMGVFLRGVSDALSASGKGGTIFFPAGKYYMTQWACACSYIRIVGEPGTLLAPGGPTNQSWGMVTTGIYIVVQFLNFVFDPTWSGVAISDAWGTYANHTALICYYCDYLLVADCSFNDMGGMGGGYSTGIVVERNKLTHTRGGMQFGPEMYQSIFSRNYIKDAIDDCINVGSSVRNIVIANNTIDNYVTWQRGGGGVAIRVGVVAPYTECADIAIIGNNISNNSTGGIVCISYSHSVNITGNTIYNCCKTTLEEGSYYLVNAKAGIMMNDYLANNWIIANNTFRGMFRALVFYGQKSLIANNTYEAIERDNVIVAGNTSMDTNVLTGKDMVFQGDTHTWKGMIKTPMIGMTTGRFGAVYNIRRFTSVAAPWMTTSVAPAFARGCETVSFEIAIAYDGPPLENVALQIYYAMDPETLNVPPVLFTVPTMTDITTQPRTVIPIVRRLIPFPRFNISITPPNGETLELRLMNTYTSTGANNNGVGFNEYDYVLNINRYDVSTTLVVGEQGANAGQLTLGPAGTGMRQIRHYPITLTLPAVGANAKVVTSPITATGISPTDILFFGSTNSSLPASLFTTGMTAGTDNFTIGIVNFTSTPYAGGDAVSFGLMSVKL